MITEKQLRTFWSKRARPEMKHFLDSDFIRHKVKYSQMIKEHFIERMPWDRVRISLDWGCGGGLVANLIQNRTGLMIADIDRESLSRTFEQIRDLTYPLIVTNLKSAREKLQIYYEGGVKPDLIYCFSTIQHFPSLKYFERVVEIWKELEPRFIAIQMRWAHELHETKDYEKHFVRALAMPGEMVFDILRPYYPIYRGQIIERSHYQFWIFELDNESKSLKPDS